MSMFYQHLWRRTLLPFPNGLWFDLGIEFFELKTSNLTQPNTDDGKGYIILFDFWSPLLTVCDSFDGSIFPVY